MMTQKNSTVDSPHLNTKFAESVPVVSVPIIHWLKRVQINIFLLVVYRAILQLNGVY